MTKTSETRKIEKKLRQLESLYIFAFEVKKYQLLKQRPDLNELEINRLINQLIQKGCE